MKATVKKGVIEVTDALAALGLSYEDIRDAILEGEIARDGCTANDPPCAPGFVAWSNTVRALRDILVPKGWTRNDDSGFSTVVSPDGTLAIAVATGDDGTGKESVNPKTKYPRGAAAEAAISRNQDSMFPQMREMVEDKNAVKKKTWILLKKRDKDSVLVELSLPAYMTKDQQVEEWLIRIILDPINIDENFMDRTDEDDSAEPPIDVPVRRR